ncbi:MAG: hypothetical protein QCI38_04590 [Candidatus Thermoplasmatota archaeon]|nr:hypothetical protein [Candidatus Thermoplasmatota archaeon]
MKVQTQKLDDIRFSIQDGEVGLQLEWRSGELFLSLRGVVIKQGETWYEIPVRDLIGIRTEESSPRKIELSLHAARVVIEGENAEFLQALRHFLLPYVEPHSTTSLMGSFLKLWALGLRDLTSLAKVLNLGPEVVSALMEQARRDGLIENGVLSEKALAHFSKDDADFLKRMEAFYG